MRSVAALESALEGVRRNCCVLRLVNGLREPTPLGGRSVTLLLLESVAAVVSAPDVAARARANFAAALEHRVQHGAADRARSAEERRQREAGMAEKGWRVEGEHAWRRALELNKRPAKEEARPFETDHMVALAGGGRHAVLLTSAGRALSFGSDRDGQLGHEPPPPVVGFAEPDPGSDEGEDEEEVAAAEAAAAALKPGSDKKLSAAEKAALAAKRKRARGKRRATHVRDESPLSLLLELVHMPGLAYEARRESAELVLKQAEERAITQGAAVMVAAEGEAAKLRAEKLCAVAAGRAHTLLLTTSGRVFSCGGHESGQIGRPSYHHSFPVMVNIAEDVVAFAAGAAHSAFITRGGRVFTCGSNEFGQLGQALPCNALVVVDKAAPVRETCTTFACDSLAFSYEEKPKPKMPPPRHAARRSSTFGKASAAEVAKAKERAAMLRRRRKLPLLELGETFVGVSAGTDHTMLWTNYGRVFCFGANDKGQLGLEASLGLEGEGDGEDSNFQSNTLVRFVGSANAPVLLSTAAMVERLEQGEKVSSIAAGDGFTLMLTSKGRAFSFGDNSHGQCGRAPIARACDFGGVRYRTVGEVFVADLSEERRRANADAVWAELEERVETEGAGDVAMRAAEELAAREADEALAAVSAGHGHALVMSTQGRVFSCGRNEKGQLGRGGDGDRLQRVDLVLAEGEQAVCIAAGDAVSTVLTKRKAAHDTRVFAFGSNQLVCELELRLAGLGGARQAGRAAMGKIRAHLAARIGTEGEAAEAAAFVATLLAGSVVDDEGLGRFVDLVRACADGVDEAALAGWEEEEQWLNEEDALRMEDFIERKREERRRGSGGAAVPLAAAAVEANPAASAGASGGCGGGAKNKKGGAGARGAFFD